MVNLPLLIFFNFNRNDIYNFVINAMENQILIDALTYKFQLSYTGEQLLIEDEIGFDADSMLLIFNKIE
ncbi:hypothetical protein [Winogradskyella arenosi]|uniref:Uncharacterized protein n=1 Tax=Winogradskyella arenosi TaxID=533325 RepID=A0A368ZFP1_9FLAO|nr:hypothetical protein [Winogradskyella arenosi]RCW92000.1 hypothetical protein DFQ08_10219 [Winogradskyella arenosi]